MASVTNKTERLNTAWEGFKGGQWKKEINTRDFIQANYTEYRGDDSFLEGIAPAQINCGQSYKNCLKYNISKMGFTIWIIISHLL